MKKLFVIFLVAFVSTLYADDTKILTELDNYRGVYKLVEMEIRVTPPNKSHSDFRVLTQIDPDAGKNSLVFFIAGKNKGRKFLMRDFDYWLFIPGSKRSIRITPIQKISGDASAGDIANISWEYDYDLESTEDLADGKKKLTLKAKRKGVTYHKQILWLSKERKPVRGELYFSSGKLAKTTNYFFDDSGKLINRIVYTNLITKKDTEVLFLSRKKAKFNPSVIFNIRNLSR